MRDLLTLEHHDPAADVLVVTNMWPNSERADYGIFVKRQVDSLIEAGLRCDVLFVRGFRSPLAYPWAALALLARSLRRRYRLVHAHSGETALPARFYLTAPVVASYCGDDLLGTPRADGSLSRSSRIRRRLLRAHSRLLARTITKSREMEGALPSRVAERNAVIPNGVDRELFAPIDRGEARRQLGWSADDRVALFAADPAVGRKRHWLAVAASDLAGARLEVATGVSPERMPLLMSAADCLLLTSSIEGSPNVVKEALMCNLPVISTPVGDVEELLDGVEPSWIRNPEPEALADALTQCMRERPRSNGRETATWLASEEIAARVLAVYESVEPAAAASCAA
jgi:teichuronic acid biosynthesis glycosyltransferase TuaC